MPQIAANVAVDAVSAGITANGRYDIFTSDEISATNSKAIVATLQVHEFLPNRDNYGKARLMMILERKDDAGNWHPVQTLFSPLQAIMYASDRNGGIIPDQVLEYGPNVFNFDGQVPVDQNDGENIISQTHKDRGVLADKFRLVLALHEKEFGGGGAFSSLKYSIDYELRAE